jgi:hypothetical protein
MYSTLALASAIAPDLFALSDKETTSEISVRPS